MHLYAGNVYQAIGFGIALKFIHDHIGASCHVMEAVFVFICEKDRFLHGFWFEVYFFRNYHKATSFWDLSFSFSNRSTSSALIGSFVIRIPTASNTAFAIAGSTA